jgi:hypothetical protein
VDENFQCQECFLEGSGAFRVVYWWEWWCLCEAGVVASLLVSREEAEWEIEANNLQICLVVGPRTLEILEAGGAQSWSIWNRSHTYSC